MDMVLRGDFAASIAVNEGSGLGRLRCSVAQDSTHLDDVVRNHTQPHPTAHAVQTGIEATTQPVSSFEHADSPLRAGSPLLPAAEPTLTLQKFSFATLRILVGHRHPPHPQALVPLSRSRANKIPHRRPLRAGFVPTSVGAPRSRAATESSPQVAQPTLRSGLRFGFPLPGS